MAALETGVKNALKANADVTSVVASRIRPLMVSQGEARPYLTYHVTDAANMQTLADGPADYRNADFEIAIYADTYEVVMDLSETIKNYFDDYGQTISGIEFAPIRFDTESDIEQVVPEGEETPIYLRVQQFKTLYRSI